MEDFYRNVPKSHESFIQKRWLFTRRKCIIFVIVILWSIYFLISGKSETQENVETELLRALKEDIGSGCTFPKINPFHEEVLKFETKAVPIVCSGQDWVHCNLSECRVIDRILAKVKSVQCHYKDIIYENDYEYSLGASQLVIGSNAYVLNKSDHVIVECTGREEGISVTWSGVALGFRKIKQKPSLLEGKNAPNILFLVFDSLSRSGFKRRLPKSYDFLTEKLGAVVMNGHNIVGDGTGIQVIAMLTGKMDLEEPNIMKSLTKINKKYMDDLPFIFYNLKDNGYRTALFEDSPHVGTFSYRYNGFRKQPTDHYLLPFSTVVHENRYNWFRKPPLSLNFANDIERKYCVGDTPEYAVMLNITRQFFLLDSKKFCFNFIVNSSHDIFSMISNVDDKLTEFLADFERDGFLKNTLLFVMGDHGPRFGPVRRTLLGKLEERLPLLAIVLPESLKRDRPEVDKILKLNSEVLTTHYDIHATVLDAVGLTKFRNPYVVPGTGIPRSLSMLQEIPRTRSCSEAGIEPQWCACIEWTDVSPREEVYEKAAESVVEFINNLTFRNRANCVHRKLFKIDWVMRQTVNKKLLTTKVGGLLGKPTSEYIQVRVIVDPGQAEYEATLNHYIGDRFDIKVGDISRTNRYGNEPHCITKTDPGLNMFCYCNDLMT